MHFLNKRHIRNGLIVFTVIAAGIAVFGVHAVAQDSLPQPTPIENDMSQVPAPPPEAQAAEVAGTPDSRDEFIAIAENKTDVRDASVTPEMLKTIFFTAWQHALLEEAKIGFNTRLPNPGEVGRADDNRPVVPGIRELTLGGIAFATPVKWTVWLNSVRVTPDAIPEQVLDIRVTRSYVDLKWYDPYTKKIFPVRMRPHERFNLDTRIFLPGTGTM